MAEIHPTTTGIPFDAWMRDVAPPTIWKPGRRNAFEYGAKAIFGARDFGSIYHRRDCQEAESDGRSCARQALARGLVILCPDCGAVYGNCRLAARTPVQEVDRER